MWYVKGLCSRGAQLMSRSSPAHVTLSEVDGELV